MTEEERVSTILAEYDSSAKTYEAFCERVEHLLNELLEISEIKISAVTSRLKARASFEDKIKSDKKYCSVTDVTDVAGARVVTYFADDVDRVDELIRDEFDIDIANMIDKRSTLKSDQFGYQSLHLVASLNKRRLTQPELRRFGGLKIEIQVRSLLQHAWAEIEHGSYKPKRPIPTSVRRSFSRVAGLLELADKEFVASRVDLVSINNGPQLCRAEGITELVPPFDVEIPFTALRANASPPNNALILFVNTPVTNRLLSSIGETEVRMEVVDGAAHLGTAVGVVGALNTLEFKNVLPMCPPPKGTSIRVRVSGLRVDASSPSTISGASSDVVQARWGFTPVPTAQDENEHFLTAWQDIAIPKRSLDFEAKSLGSTELVDWYRRGPYKQIGLRVTFRGLVPNAFRTRAQERSGCRMTPRATRLAVRIDDLPPGSRIFATFNELLRPPNGASFRLMVNVNSLGDGEVRFMNPAFTGIIDDADSKFAELPYAGTGFTAWECCGSVQSDQVVSFGLLVIVRDDAKLNGISVSGFYAPLSTSTHASQHASIPRFTDLRPERIRPFDGVPS